MPTIYPQLQTSLVMSCDELSLLGGVFTLLGWAVRTVQS
jgi:hypothetical protein